MGTDIIITADIAIEKENILIEAENIIIDFEKRFSRFIVNNELSRFNSSPDLTLELSKTFTELLIEIEKYNYLTEGIFDPTIIGILEKIGYDRSFDKIESRSSKPGIGELKSSFMDRVKINQLKINGSMVSRPLNLRIDLGGIGKGYIVDFIAKTLFSNIKNFWISAGGDILATGCGPDKNGWEIGVQNPSNPDKDLFIINTRNKKIGIATSGIIKRHGQSGNLKWHHIIDPRTGLPAQNNILSVTVVSSSVIKADVFAKTVLILGEIDGLNFIENDKESAAIIFTKTSSPILSSRASLYLKE